MLRKFFLAFMLIFFMSSTAFANVKFDGNIVRATGMKLLWN